MAWQTWVKDIHPRPGHGAGLGVYAVSRKHDIELVTHCKVLTESLYPSTEPGGNT
jgi:hypothetical protein